MGLRRLVPYIIGLIALAFALGSLPRGSPGGSLLFRSYWLLYTIELAPILVLGIMAAIIAYLALNWRDIGGAIGFKMAQNRKTRKRRSRYSLIITIVMWAIAVVVLIEKPGTIFNHSNPNDTIANIQGDTSNSTLPFHLNSILPTISNLVQNSWFDIAFLGLLAVGGLVLVQSLIIAAKETGEMNLQELQTRRIEALVATQDAIKLVDDSLLDPRSRIIKCFQRLMMAVARMGIPVSADQTARELDGAIRSTFALEGSASSDLTQLFEEARYSQHDINDEDAERARQCLEEISDELRIRLDK